MHPARNRHVPCGDKILLGGRKVGNFKLSYELSNMKHSVSAEDGTEKNFKSWMGVT